MVFNLLLIIIPTAELVITIEILTNKAKAEIGTHLMIAETRTIDFSI